MFITFSTDAYENISYFSDVGKQLLSLMGHSGTIPGALKASEVPDALQRLQSALHSDHSTQESYDDDGDAIISLSKRSIPLINLMHFAQKKNCDILWGWSKSPD